MRIFEAAKVSGTVRQEQYLVHFEGAFPVGLGRRARLTNGAVGRV